ncbi:MULTISPECIES: branched-chain amino acid ABC transporter permease [Rhodococcus]|uniref:Branched-chain amino acid ABC transporter permease n=1 Tax=Rhodococcus globerulus TaxID=33008 RepID=A0ABU4BY85_RHOGO|nr:MULTISPECIES: branched-chain amino acid ABC transporter permease [Rhodococcus]MDV6268976.1 branched-chain amino acid ABC transporter permease [Rhodococcus globerulus]MDV8067460.1 branched-chain amino acid ABC transporter permease [Rhodococcus sp. IEGM 1366]
MTTAIEKSATEETLVANPVGAKRKRSPRLIERGSTTYRILLGVGFAVAAGVIAWGGSLGPFEQGQLTRVAIYAIAIAGLNIATGYLGLISVGHSAFFGLGAFTTGVLVVKYGWSPLATMPAALLICFVVGLVVGLPALRIKGLYLATVTLAFGVAFPEIIAYFSDLTGGSKGMTIPRALLRPPSWSGFTLGEKDQWLYWLSVVVLLVVAWVIRNLVRSRYGMAMLAVRDNEIAAAASGINIASVKTTGFGVSGAITGVAGSLFAMYMGSLYAEGSFTLLAGITLLIGLVIGGSSTQMGPLIGALIVVYLPYYTSDIGQGQGAAVLFAVILIAVIFVAPDGVAGAVRRGLARFVTVQPVDPPPALIPSAPSGDQSKQA